MCVSVTVRSIVRNDWIAIQSSSLPINPHQRIEIDQLMEALNPSNYGIPVTSLDGHRVIDTGTTTGICFLHHNIRSTKTGRLHFSKLSQTVKSMVSN